VTILTQILARKRDEAARRAEPLAAVRTRAEARPAGRPFAAALRVVRRPAVIAEFKRRSPSFGWIHPEARPAEVARAYAAGGAAAMSVLTDGEGFGGALEHLVEARAAMSIAVLRKDFLLDEYDLWAARAAGADAALLIVAAFEDAGALGALVAAGAGMGLELLVEAHDAREVEVALAVGAQVIGVNARDLRTFEIDRGLPARLRPMVPADRVFVAESGIGSAAGAGALRAAGVDAILVGETLMRAADPAAALRALVG
jgi:indole-3-glycerol phosphate synthase